MGRVSFCKLYKVIEACQAKNPSLWDETRVRHPSRKNKFVLLCLYIRAYGLFIDVRGCWIWRWLEGLNWTAQEWKIDRRGSPYRLFDSIKPNPRNPQALRRESLALILHISLNFSLSLLLVTNSFKYSQKKKKKKTLYTYNMFCRRALTQIS